MNGQSTDYGRVAALLLWCAPLGPRSENQLLVRILIFLIFCFALERLQVPNRDLAAVDRNSAFSLQSAQTARNKLSHRADLCRKFLLAGRENDLHPACCALPVAGQA